MNTPDSPPQVIHMPLEDLIDPELSFDDPDSAGPNPTAYILKSDVDKMAEALRIVQVNPLYRLPVEVQCAVDEALATYGEEK